MGKILITGVDGNFGAHAAATIMGKVPAERLIFTSPNEKALEQYAQKGIETRLVNFNEPANLKTAFAGADTVLLISMPFVGEKRREAHKIAVDACLAAGVKRLVYTSIVGAGSEDCDAYEIADHKYTERYILEQRIGYVFLRNSQYAEAMVSAYEEAHANTDDILTNNMGDGLMAFVSRNDCAEAAACAAAGAGETNTAYYISGPEAMTITRYIELANSVTGFKVRYEEVSDEENYAFFDSIGVPRTTEDIWADTAKNFPFCSDGMVTFGRAIRLDQMSRRTNDFELLTGKKPLGVKEIFENLDSHRIGSRTSTD